MLGLGGSTNAVIHLIAMAGRAGIGSPSTTSTASPAPCRCSPTSGPAAEVPHGGLPLRRRPARLPLADHRPAAPGPADRRRQHAARAARGRAGPQRRRHPPPRDNPVAAEGGVAVLRGNLCPDGAVIKHIAAEPQLLKHTGPAVVFDDYGPMQRTINDPALGITADSVLVLRNAGPKGGPGMPEYGMLPIPTTC